MKFTYTYQQKNGKLSQAQVELDDVIHTKIILLDTPVLGEDGITTVGEQEVISLELKYNHQQEVEKPIEQARTKEQKAKGERNISHSQWELAWIPYVVYITTAEDVKHLKEILSL